jgi:hypothetical protein
MYEDNRATHSSSAATALTGDALCERHGVS